MVDELKLKEQLNTALVVRAVQAYALQLEHALEEAGKLIQDKNDMLEMAYYALNKAGNLPKDEVADKGAWLDQYYALANRCDAERKRR